MSAAPAPDPASLPFVPAEPGTAATTFTCALCGGRFQHGLQVCSACPLSGGCDLVRCPHCGYQFPRTSALVELGRRVLRGLRRRP